MTSYFNKRPPMLGKVRMGEEDKTKTKINIQKSKDSIPTAECKSVAYFLLLFVSSRDERRSKRIK